MDPSHEMEAQVGHSTILAWCGMPQWRKELAKGRNWVQEMMKKTQPKKDEVTVAHLKVTKTAYETLAEEGRWCALPRTEGIGPHGS